MSDPFRVVRDFESALCEYTGAPYATTTTSCTMALLLSTAWHLRNEPPILIGANYRDLAIPVSRKIEIPKRTYVGVPYAILQAGGRPVFRDEGWFGMYRLSPLPVIDSARWFTSGLYKSKTTIGESVTCDSTGLMLCVSFHWSKTLGIQQGGAILHDSPEADVWLRRARFDGRTEGVTPKDDTNWPERAWHAYMSPEVAAEGLVRLSHLPLHNAPLPNSDYPDLSQMECFK